jgi:hypothetical protein
MTLRSVELNIKNLANRIFEGIWEKSEGGLDLMDQLMRISQSKEANLQIDEGEIWDFKIGFVWLDLLSLREEF